MKESSTPDWLDHARWYYSEISGDYAQPVSVFDASGREEVSSDSPGTLYLSLEPRRRYSPRLRVLDAGGREAGLIGADGLVPGVSYAMRRNGETVWRLSVRSIVRKRHVLEVAHGDSWTFDTPFFWWQNLTGTARGVPRLVGGYGQVAWIWGIWIEPGWDSIDILAAVAFMHRQWFHM
jgi:hypothetical protein